MEKVFHKAARWRGLFVLVLWQAAPVGVDEYGRTRLGFGFGAGTIEFTTISCEGDVLESESVGYATVGANVEHWLSPGRVLLRASGGYSSSDSTTLSGPFGAIMLSREWRRFGIGGGVALVPEIGFDAPEPEKTTATRPSGYIRGGNRDKLHVRMDLFPPSLQTHVVPWSLMVGHNQFGRGRPSGALGFGLIGTEDPTGGAVAEGFLPVARNADIGARGYVSPGREKGQVGIAAQLRFTLK